jgi:uncharacterized protein
MSRGKRISLPVVSCDGCGACCMTQGSPPALVYEWPQDKFVWEQRVPTAWMRGLPPDLFAELDAYYDAMINRGSPGRPEMPCLWLDVETRRCRHYEHRPAICRDFPVGEGSCLAWRKEFGLPVPGRPPRKRPRGKKGKGEG